MRSKTSLGMIQTSCLISPHLNELRKKHGITISEAIRVGITMILAEKGLSDYDNKLNLFRKMKFFQQQAEEAMQELEKIKDEYIQKGSKERIQDS